LVVRSQICCPDRGHWTPALQQGSPVPPQEVQLPPWQMKPKLQLVPQQAWPLSPQAWQVVPRQAVPASLQTLPGQQVWPSLPQLLQRF
jgi:hypothetical protein